MGIGAATSGGFELTWVSIEDCRQLKLNAINVRHQPMQCHIPQKPVSRPTAKQLVSLLNEADKAMGPEDSSMIGRVFILNVMNHSAHGVTKRVRFRVRKRTCGRGKTNRDECAVAVESRVVVNIAFCGPGSASQMTQSSGLAQVAPPMKPALTHKATRHGLGSSPLAQPQAAYKQQGSERTTIGLGKLTNLQQAQ